MTDRHAGYIVTLAQDIREDDAEESVLIALRMVKGVADVRPVPADFSAASVAVMRRDLQWREALEKTTREMSWPDA